MLESKVKDELLEPTHFAGENLALFFLFSCIYLFYIGYCVKRQLVIDNITLAYYKVCCSFEFFDPHDGHW